jgi:cytoskeletal protein CcmA (bactofilin family)
VGMSLKHCLRFGLAVASVLVLLLAASTAFAAQSSGPESKFRTGRDVIVPAGETIPHDLYVAASTVRIDGSIEGDLIVAGGRVEVTGPVGGDVTAAGRSVTIWSEVAGDVRVAGGDVTLEGPVHEDVLAGAGTLTVTSGGRVGGDLIFSSGQTTMDGAVAGNVLGSTGSYAHNGSVAGTEKVRVEEPRERAPSPARRMLTAARHYVGVVLFGILLLLLLPAPTAAAADMVRQRLLASLGMGVIGAVGFVIALVALMLVTGLVAVVLGLLTLGGLVALTVAAGVLAMLATSLFFFLSVFFVADAIVGLALGRLALRRGAELSRPADLGALALGVAVLAVVGVVPLLGPLVRLLTALVGLGALLQILWRTRTTRVGADLTAAAGTP